jgi:hypothetical protein
MSILALWGAALIALCAWFVWREHKNLADSFIVPGKVVELVLRQSGRNVSSRPKISFVTPEKGSYTFGSSLYLHSFKVGDVVNVAYRMEDGQVADPRLVRFGHRFGFAYCGIGIGLLMLFVAGGFTYGNPVVERLYPVTHMAHRPTEG